MVKKIVGYYEDGNKVFERDAREYDKNINTKTVLGITIGDIVKAVPIIFACAFIYADDRNFKADQLKFNEHVIESLHDDSSAIGGIKDVLNNLNDYLSASTGKVFRDGTPDMK